MTAVQQGPAAPIAWLQKKLTRPAGDSRAGRVRHGGGWGARAGRRIHV